MLRVILALDLMNGIAVHAIRGERHLYKPLRSKICSSPDPKEIIAALNPREVYIADLDRIARKGDNFEVIKTISKQCSTMVDVGIGSYEELLEILNKKLAHKLVLGTETANLKLIQAAAEHDVTVSIDIKQNKLLSQDPDLASPVEAAKMISKVGIAEIIVLNLDKVGTASGVDLEILQQIKAQVKGSRIIAGGGVRDMEDLKILEEIGVDGAIVATAIHNGSIPVERLR
ncbi:MAG: HisA/HisF-related TIM barrel protein [Methanocellales archaeon]